MAKDAYYFSHDSNASQDPKILQMRSVYGAEGYGWYWMLIEMMREQDDFRLPISGKYALNAYAMHMQCECMKLASFIDDCVNEFYLFFRDEDYIWSESLVRRMNTVEEKSKKAKNAAAARWSKDKKEEFSNSNGSEDCTNANAMQTQCECNADALKINAKKEKKGKEKKGNEIKEREDAHARDGTFPYGKFKNVFLTREEYEELKGTFQAPGTLIGRLSSYKKSTGQHYQDDYATLLIWADKDGDARRPKPKPEDEPAEPVEAVPMPDEIKAMIGGMFKSPV